MWGFWHPGRDIFARSATASSLMGHSALAIALSRAQPRSRAASLAGLGARVPCSLLCVRAERSRRSGQGRRSTTRAPPPLAQEPDLSSPAAMRTWLRSQPQGFGDAAARVQDTSTEDELLKEMRRTEEERAARQRKEREGEERGRQQPRNEQRTRSGEEDKGRGGVGVKGSRPLQRAEPLRGGVLVRVSGLPKKRNVERDLRSAVRHSQGLLEIVAQQQGSAKTRDPVCTGTALLQFADATAAHRFVLQFHEAEPISFGKLQKRIKCTILTSTGTGSSSSSNTTNTGYQHGAPLALPPIDTTLGKNRTDPSLRPEALPYAPSPSLSPASSLGSSILAPIPRERTADTASAAVAQSTTVQRLRVRDPQYVARSEGEAAPGPAGGTRSAQVEMLGAEQASAGEKLEMGVRWGPASLGAAVLGKSGMEAGKAGVAARDADVDASEEEKADSWSAEYENEDDDSIWDLLENEEDEELNAELEAEEAGWSWAEDGETEHQQEFTEVEKEGEEQVVGFSNPGRAESGSGPGSQGTEGGPGQTSLISASLPRSLSERGRHQRSKVLKVKPNLRPATSERTVHSGAGGSAPLLQRLGNSSGTGGAPMLSQEKGHPATVQDASLRGEGDMEGDSPVLQMSTEARIEALERRLLNLGESSPGAAGLSLGSRQAAGQGGRDLGRASPGDGGQAEGGLERAEAATAAVGRQRGRPRMKHGRGTGKEGTRTAPSGPTDTSAGRSSANLLSLLRTKYGQQHSSAG